MQDKIFKLHTENQQIQGKMHKREGKPIRVKISDE